MNKILPYTGQSSWLLCLAQRVALLTLLCLYSHSTLGADADDESTGWAQSEKTNEEFTSVNNKSLWNFNNTDLEPDPNIQWGHISNGLRYAIYPHPGPPSIRLFVDMGFIMEDGEEEEGFVDFIGKYFSHKHKGAGLNAQAITDFQSTTYALDLSGKTSTEIDTALALLATHSTELTKEFLDLECTYNELSHTENILFEEPCIKKTLRQAFLFSGSQLERKSSILDFNPDSVRLKHFLDHWHTPDRMTLFISGDVNPDLIASKIEALFSSLPANALYYRPDPIINPNHPTTDAYVLLSPEENTSKIIIETLSRQKESFDSKDLRRSKVMRELEEILVRQRLEEAKDKSAALISVSVKFENYLNEFDIRRIKLESTPDHWEEAVNIAVQKMLEIVYQDAFNEKDFEEAKQILIEDYKDQIAKASKRNNKEHCDNLIQQTKNKRVITSDRYNYELLINLLQDITVQDCNDELLTLWNTQECYLIAEGNIGIEDPNEALDALVQAYLNSVFDIKSELLGGLDLPKNFALRRAEDPAEMLLYTPLEHLGILQTSFSNGVHLNIALNHANSERILVALRFGGGLLSESAETRGMHLLAEKTFIAGGLEKYSQSSIQHILEVLDIHLSFETTEDAFILRGECNPDSVETLLHLLYAYYTEPNYDEIAFENTQLYLSDLYANAKNSPANVLKSQGRYYLYDTNSVFKLPPRDQLLSYSLENFQAWFNHILQTSPLEVSIVGPLSPESVQTLIQSFQGIFGYLDDHPSVISSDYEHRILHLNREQSTQTLYHKGNPNEALTRITWPTCDGWSKLGNRKLRILSKIIEARVKQALSRDFNEAHDVDITSLNSLAFYNLGCIQIDLVTDIKDTSAAEHLIVNEADKILESIHISYEDFSHGIKPKLDELANLKPNIWESKTKNSLETYIESHIRPIAETAQSLINASNISYEVLRSNMPEQVGYLTKVAYKIQQFSKNKSELEEDFQRKRQYLLKTIKALNPTDQTILETENIVKPTLNALVQAKQKIEKITGMEARSNLKRWFLEKTNDLLKKLKSLAEMNGIAQSTPPEAIAPLVETLRSIPNNLPSNDNEDFFALFKEKATLQSSTIEALIEAVNNYSLHIYGDVTEALTPHKTDFKHIAQNLSFQEKSVIISQKSISKKTQTLLDRIWGHNPIVDDKEEVRSLVEPKIESFLESAKTLYQYTELESELESAKNALIKDAWSLLNPYQITLQELREAIQSIKQHLESKANTPEYWLNNVLIGSHYYPQKLDWAPCLISDYTDVTLQDIQGIIRQYIDPKFMHIVRVLPEGAEPSNN